MTARIDAERLNQLLLAAERNVHRHGWDAPAQLLALVDTTAPGAEHWCQRCTFGPTTRVGGYATARCVPRTLLDGKPIHVLFRLALNFRHSGHRPELTRMRQLLRPPGLLGLAAVLEAWIRPVLTEQEQSPWGNRAAADVPGSRESRFVVAAAVNKATFHVVRIRGQQPTATGASDFDGIGGTGVHALHTIVAAVTGQTLPRETRQVPIGWDWDKELAE